MRTRFLFVFDTTGSMKDWIASVIDHVGVIAANILGENTDSVVGFLAYGDYCDGPKMIQDSTNPSYTYNGFLTSTLTPELRFINNSSEIERWLSRSHATSGGDTPECVEYVLHYIRSYHVVSAVEAKEKLIILWVGDAPPHEDLQGTSYTIASRARDYNYNFNVHNIAWRQELTAIKDHVTIYTALCGADRQAQACWETMSQQTKGVSVDLRNIENLIPTMIAVAKREQGNLDEYAQKLREEGTNSEMEEILVDLGATCFDR